MGGADRLELRGALRTRLESRAGRRTATRGRARPGRARMGERPPPARAPRRLHEDARRISGEHRDEPGDGTAMRTLSLPLIVGALLLTAVVPGDADEFKPAYLQLTQLEKETYDVLWKIPAIDEATTLKVTPQFPDGTEALTEVRSTFSRGVTVQRWRIRVPHGLDGKSIFFSHLSETRIDVLARHVRLEVVKTYTILGIEHILSGFDHLLFVLALVLLVQGTHRLLFTITAFTVAHSLTLAGATLGLVHVPGPPVEASIALSIVFVASEIVHTRQGRFSVT